MEPLPAARRVIRVGGIVQGVGFRPAIFRLAEGLRLGGFVRNEAGSVEIEIEGPQERLARFLLDLPGVLPPAARVAWLESREIPARGENAFQILASNEALAPSCTIPADRGPCEACLAELADPGNRRHRHPFVNCTECGPRFSIVRALPYDRERTTMAGFALCAACRREYADPGNRRFHAEPIACPACGPKLSWIAAGARGSGEQALQAAVRALREGGIVAVKGVGGYVLSCDATSEAAVARLRERKRRRDKPLAVLARDLGAVERISVVSPEARAALLSPARPVVILPRREGVIAAGISPGLRDVGVFLPPSPLQHLLVAEGPPLQVATSGNVAGEPIAIDDDDALERLAGICDGFLLHDRPIHARADDSVVRIMGGLVVPVRRSRGHVPEPIDIPVAGPSVLAVGGMQKNTVCLTRGSKAFLSAHVGDLDHPEAFEHFEGSIAHLQRLLGATPAAIAHDLHPEYRSTRYALAAPLPRIAVQHHHAHVASCLAEHGRTGPVIGVAFDGTGYGPGGALWGGEFLVADLGSYRRVGHLRELALPGGEAAIRQPWRLALSALHDAGIPISDRKVRILLETGISAPRSSGAGRWFDAVAALLGLRNEISYDGQAAAELEAVASTEPLSPYPLERTGDSPFMIDLRPATRAIVDDLGAGVPIPVIAGRFHATLAHAIRGVCRTVKTPDTVALTGGCFQNRLLTERTRRLLEADGFEVLLHHRVPPNDGGLALGQAAVASYLLGRS